MPQPNKIPKAFAASGDRNIIPESTGTLGLASWNEGFPAITSVPFAEGGLAPKRADFNGIFNALSLAALWYQQGGVFVYDNTTDYEVGNVVLYSGNLYKCLSANGPSSTVKAPTDTTVWSKVMTAADAAALYLPLSGGTLTGTLYTKDVYFDNAAIRAKTDAQNLNIYGGIGYLHGAYIVLNGKDSSSEPGRFYIRADDGVTFKALIGKTDGTLRWDNNDVATIRAGAWTPELVGNVTPGTYTYKTQSGAWSKIGDLVYITADIEIGDYTVHPYGRAYITGLPFAVWGEATAISVRGSSGQSNCFLKCVRAVTGNGYSRIFLQGIDQTNNTVDDLTFSNSSQTNGRYLSLATPSGTNTTGRLVLSGCYRSQ